MQVWQSAPIFSPGRPLDSWAFQEFELRLSNSWQRQYMQIAASAGGMRLEAASPTSAYESPARQDSNGDRFAYRDPNVYEVIRTTENAPRFISRPVEAIGYDEPPRAVFVHVGKAAK